MGAWQEVRFAASSFCGCVGARQEVRFVASSFCGCVGTWQEVRFVASSFVILWGHGQKYDLLPLFFGGECKTLRAPYFSVKTLFSMSFYFKNLQSSWFA